MRRPDFLRTWHRAGVDGSEQRWKRVLWKITMQPCAFVLSLALPSQNRIIDAKKAKQNNNCNLGFIFRVDAAFKF